MSQQYSWVWSHFTTTSNNRAQCNKCNALITVNGTSGMIKHLTRYHNEELEEKSNKLEYVVKFIVTSELPFIVTENYYLRKLIGKNVDRNIVSENVVLLKNNMGKFLKEYLNDVNEMSLIIDEWYSDNSISFLGLIVNFINMKSNCLEEVMIDCKKLNSSCSSSIQQSIVSTLMNL